MDKKVDSLTRPERLGTVLRKEEERAKDCRYHEYYYYYYYYRQHCAKRKPAGI